MSKKKDPKPQPEEAPPHLVLKEMRRALRDAEDNLKELEAEFTILKTYANLSLKITRDMLEDEIDETKMEVEGLRKQLGDYEREHLSSTSASNVIGSGN